MNHISTVSLQEKQHDKGDYARGVFSGRVAEQHPLKQRLKLEGDKAHILRLVKDSGMWALELVRQEILIFRQRRIKCRRSIQKVVGNEPWFKKGNAIRP